MKFSVVLYIHQDDPAFEIYSHLGERIEVGGKSCLLLSGEQPEFGGHYVQFRLSEPEAKQGLVIWIPHQYILLSFSDDQNRDFGFLKS